ncbi:MAG: GAF domain-containing sensor histidine kinase [Armatimonadetes bacterium]|nr:GAF domain-containing sensor histidine kinase [Armatimonadota bacterium]
MSSVGMLPIHETSRLLEAVHLATRKLASPADLNVVLRDVLEISVQAVGAEGGTIYLHEPAHKRLRFAYVYPEDVAEQLERLDIPDDYGIAGDVFQTQKARVNNFPQEGQPGRLRIREKTGITVRSMMTLPLGIPGMDPVGVVQLVNKLHGGFNETDEVVLDTVSDVATLAIMNSRLLTQQTRVASLEGMGRAAHDLANKAGVLLTFIEDFRRNLNGLKEALGKGPTNSEACFHLEMLEGSFEDVFAPYSERVYRYARLINDLAAGKKLTPKLKTASLAAVVKQSAQYLESPARKAHVRIVYDLEEGAPEFAFDDLYVIRIVENLVGNAIKAVAEMVTDEWLAENATDDDAYFGDVTVRYRYRDKKHVLEVQDEGPGIPPAVVRNILAGTASSSWQRAAGSGLGTKVVMELATALNAKVSVQSKLGEGTTFVLEFPG